MRTRPCRMISSFSLLCQTLLCLCWTATQCSSFSSLSPPSKGSSNAQQGLEDEIVTNIEFPLASEEDVKEITSLFLNGESEAKNNNNNNNNNKNNISNRKSTSSRRNTNTKFRTAVLLNTNARGVSTDLVPIAQEIFGKDYVYVTQTEEEGKLAAANMIIQQDISMVIPVGGDGTLSSLINFLCDSIIEREQQQREGDAISSMTMEDAMKQLPLIGYIPLGTGNGVGSVVGSETMSDANGSNFPAPWRIFGQKRRKLRQVRNMLEKFRQVGKRVESNSNDPNYLSQPQSPYDVIELPMMEVSYPQHNNNNDDDDDGDEDHGTLCFFAGAGFDSLMLQDFQSIKKWAVRTKILTKTLSSVAGYCVALVVKTLPKCVARQEHNINVKVTTRDPNTLWVDHRRGDVVQKVGPTTTDNNKHQEVEDQQQQQQQQTLLYEGTTGILAAGTSPFYGGGLRLFPFARLTTDKMHLRLGRIHPLRGFISIPQIFQGSYRDKRSSSFGCLDYIGGDFDVTVTSSTTKVDATTREPIKGFPIQHSGESVGYFERFRLRVIGTPIKFVTLMEKRVIREQQEEVAKEKNDD